MASTSDADREFTLVIPPDEPSGAAILDQLSALVPGLPLVPYRDLAAAAQENTKTTLLLVISHPVEAIARRLAVSGHAEQALAEWQASTALVLTAARRVRRRLWVIDARALCAGNADTLALFEPATEQTSVAAVAPLPAPVFLLMAAALLARNSEAGHRADELAALRRGGGDDPVSAHLVETACTDYARLLTERNLLRNHISLHLAETERLVAESDSRPDLSYLTALESERDALKAQAADMAAKEALTGTAFAVAGTDLAALKASAADSHLQKAKAEALQRRLEQSEHRAALREAIFGTVLLEDQKIRPADPADDHRHRIAELERELQRVYASKSWRITRPLRALRAPRQD